MCEIAQLAVPNRIGQSAVFDGFAAGERRTIFEDRRAKKRVAAGGIPLFCGILREAFGPVLAHGRQCAE